jgi:hypothetical protein
MKILTNILIWIFAILLTGTVLIYQRLTGPTYPKRGNIEIGNQKIEYKLLRTWENEKDAADRRGARIAITAEDPSITGICRYKRLGTADEWTSLQMLREEDELVATLPAQPAAGKLLYLVSLSKGSESYSLTEEPVVIRFKDWIPGWIPFPHVLLIFVALLFSTMAAVEALRRGKQVMIYTILTLISMLVGGLIMGPIMQKYAFGAYWTGWPIGHDLTDNKTLVAFIVWLIAFFVLRRNPGNRFWPVFAALITLLVFIVPHSMFGSEFDYAAGEVKTGR